MAKTTQETQTDEDVTLMSGDPYLSASRDVRQLLDVIDETVEQVLSKKHSSNKETQTDEDGISTSADPGQPDSRASRVRDSHVKAETDAPPEASQIEQTDSSTEPAQPEPQAAKDRDEQITSKTGVIPQQAETDGTEESQHETEKRPNYSYYETRFTFQLGGRETTSTRWDGPDEFTEFPPLQRIVFRQPDIERLKEVKRLINLICEERRELDTDIRYQYMMGVNDSFVNPTHVVSERQQAEQKNREVSEPEQAGEQGDEASDPQQEDEEAYGVSEPEQIEEDDYEECSMSLDD